MTSKTEDEKLNESVRMTYEYDLGVKEGIKAEREKLDNAMFKVFSCVHPFFTQKHICMYCWIKDNLINELERKK